MSSKVKDYNSWKSTEGQYVESNIDRKISFLEESYSKVSKLRTLGVVFNKGLELERISTNLDAAYAYKEGKIDLRQMKSIERRATVVYEQKKSQADSQAQTDAANAQAQQYLWRQNFNSWR
jgi:hypothetical protein